MRVAISPPRRVGAVGDLREREAGQKRKLRLCAVGTLATIFALCIMAGAALGVVAPGMWSNVMSAIDGTNRAKGESDAVRLIALSAATRCVKEGVRCEMEMISRRQRPPRCVSHARTAFALSLLLSFRVAHVGSQAAWCTGVAHRGYYG